MLDLDRKERHVTDFKVHIERILADLKAGITDASVKLVEYKGNTHLKLTRKSCKTIGNRLKLT